MVRTLTLAASVSALALAACGEDASDDAPMADEAAGEASGMAGANSRMAEGSRTMAAEERRADADARMEGGMGGDGAEGRAMGAAAEGDGAVTREGSDMSGAAGDPPDAGQSEAVSDFTYGAEYAEEGAGAAPPTDAIQLATERVLGMTRDALEDFEPDADAYARAVAMANHYQIEAGRLAAERGGEPEIRQLGEAIRDTHAGQLDSLQTALQTAGQGVQTPTELDRGRRDVLAALEDVAAVNFDPVFVRQQTNLHEALNTLHQAYAEAGTHEALVTFAEAAQERTGEALERIRNDHEAALDPN